MVINGIAARPLPVPLALVVDPDVDTRKLHALTLESIATEVQEAEDGADALAKALIEPPALVLTELRLPRVDGYSLCSMLREDPATQEALILVVTGSAQPADVTRARRAGADDVLVKPIDPDQVREHTRQLVMRSRELRASSQQSRERMSRQLARSRDLLEESARKQQRMMSRSYARERTTTPPMVPPSLRCPSCDLPLTYDHSNVGGVSPKFPEQWDYLVCGRCEGHFQYRHRTRHLRQI